MILPDINILVYAYSSDFPQHPAARAWLEDLFNGPQTAATSWLTLWGFVRITTNPRALPKPYSPEQALRVARTLLEASVLLEPGPRHMDLLQSMVTDGQASGSRVSDAALAALAIEHGATLASTDRDFSRFAGLKWIHPMDSQRPR